jgi:hypothetical protein
MSTAAAASAPANYSWGTREDANEIPIDVCATELCLQRSVIATTPAASEDHRTCRERRETTGVSERDE